MAFGAISFRAQRRRQLRRRLARRDDAEPVLVLDDVTAALGRQPQNDARRPRAATVALAEIVGTVGRRQAFDRMFRPRQAHLRERWERQASVAVDAHDPVALVRVGEVFFVEDGHHRFSVARARGQQFIDAAVRSLCTVAFTPRDLGGARSCRPRRPSGSSSGRSRCPTPSFASCGWTTRMHMSGSARPRASGPTRRG